MNSYKIVFVNPKNDIETATYFGDFADAVCADKKARQAFMLDAPLKAETWVVKSVEIVA